MCLQDYAIERKLTSRVANINAGAFRYEFAPNPIRHTVIIPFGGSTITVRSGDPSTGPIIYNQMLNYFDGAGVNNMGFAVVLRRDDYGDLLSDALFITNGLTTATSAPREVFPDVEVDGKVERALT